MLLGLGLLLLGLAWAGANPPAASPDEPDNYVKTLATGRMNFSDAPYVGDTSSLNSLARPWYLQTGRSYLLPARLAPTAAVTCFAFDPRRAATCQADPRRSVGAGSRPASSAQGTYEPALYLLPGLATLGTGSFYDAQLRARIANAGVAGLFLTWAALLLVSGSRGLLPLVGVAVAVTPMVIFLSASVGTGGTETAAAVCFWAALLRLWRSDGAGRNRGVWTAVAVSGSTLALARMIDPLFIAMMLAWVAGLLGVRRSWQAILRGAGPARWAVGTGAAAVVFTALWDALVMPHPPFQMALARQALGGAVRGLPNQVRQVVGIFGWNDTTMPLAGYLLWLVAVVVLVGLALTQARLRERVVLSTLVVAVVVLDVLIAVGLEAQIGFGMQARYLLPVAVGVPLIGAEILDRRWRPGSRTSRTVTVSLLGLAASVHVLAWLANARRYAVGQDGPWAAFWRAGWSPVGGWALWGGLAVTGAICVAASAVVAREPGRLGFVTVRDDAGESGRLPSGAGRGGRLAHAADQSPRNSSLWCIARGSIDAGSRRFPSPERARERGQE